MIDHKHNDDAWDKGWRVHSKLLDPPPKLLPSEWADRYRVLSKEASADGGRFTCFPFQREPMDSVLDPAVISTTLMWASQVTGKTETVNCLVGYFIHQDPSPMLMIQPTERPMAEAWSKDRLATMVRDTPVLSSLLNPARQRDSGNTIFHKSFPGGHITIGGANAPSGLASRPVRVIFGDELDRWPMSAGREGDPLALAVVRTESFWNACVFKVSTPTIKGMSRIESEYEATDKRNWMVHCPKCGYEHTLLWNMVKWPKDHPEKAEIECPGCAAMHSDKTRMAMVSAGYWKPTAEFNGHRGYWLSGLNALFRAKKGYRNRLHQAAATFLDAKKKGKESLQVFINTFLAETFEDETEQLPWESVVNRRENYLPDELPDEGFVLTAGVDVQDDRLECEVILWGIGEESWGVEHKVFMGPPARPEVWAALDTFLMKSWKTKAGLELRLSAVCIDTGGHHTKRAYSFIRPRQSRRVYAVKGSSMAGTPLVSRPKKSGVERVSLLMIGTDTAKELIYGRLKIDQPGPGYIHIPTYYDEEWCKQLVSERVQTVFKFGQAQKKFIKNGRNEALDLRVYATAAFSLLGYNMEKLAKVMALKVETMEKEKTPQPEVIQQPFSGARRARRGGFATNY